MKDLKTPDELVSFAAANKCSDVHLTEGAVPSFRQHGLLVVPNGEIITRDDIGRFLPPDKKKELAFGHDLDFSTAFAGGRQRVNVYWDSGRMVAAVRLLSDHIPTMEELFLPPVLKTLADEPRGLILVTGPTGSGKSTTLASMVNYIGNSRRCHIITIEDPIEYVYRETHSLIHQREVGRDVESFNSALRSALREDPDVILVGEMRDYETISAAVTAAETGHLVLSTLHTTGASHTVDRIIDIFPPHGQAQIRAQLSNTLKGVITQQLVPLASGTGRIAATEIMIGTDAVCNLIREGKSHQLSSAIQSGGAAGMHTLDSCLASYVKRGIISMETAEKCAANVSDLMQFIR